MQTGRLLSIFTLVAAICSPYASAMKNQFQPVEEPFALIRQWMQNDFIVPQKPRSSSTNTSIGVVLRHHGEVMGYGRGKSLEETVRIAFHPLIRRNKMFQGDLRESFRQEFIDAISIELETNTKQIPSPHRDITRFAKNFNYGGSGIAVRFASSFDFRLPSELRLSPHRGASNITESLCINLGVHPTIVLSHKLPVDADITLYTLPCETYLQENAQSPIVQLHHGDELIEFSPLVPSNLTHLADSIASHLLESTGSGSVIGGYQPETDTFTDMFATHFVQTLTADALHRYSQVTGVANAPAASTASIEIIESIAHEVQKTQSIDIESASLIVTMLLQSNIKQSTMVQQLFELCQKDVLKKTTSILQDQGTDLSAFQLALLCSAAFEIEKRSEEDSFELSVSLCSFCWKCTTAQGRASLIPWIVNPMIAFEQMKPGSFAAPLEELSVLAKASQVDKDGVDRGGFMLKTNAGLTVDARGLRMIPMLSHICGTSTDAFAVLCKAIRYTEQLTTQKARSQRFENPAMALGGVRESTWNAVMPTEASSMALLGVVDALQVVIIIEASVE